MSKANGDSLHLSGTGAAYIRVSTDQQDTERQYAGVRSFEQRHGVTIAKQHWHKDEGWARDKADTRPAFQQLMKLAEAGSVKWIVVDALDRFGTKDAKQLVSYLHRLSECGCKLFDTAGKEWTAADIATIITAVVEGEKSKGEQISKSHRVLGGKAEKAKAGEYQGGPVRLGFDVGAFSRETGAEVWRVVFEDNYKRLKVYPDGRTERFDGKGNFPKHQDVVEVLRVVPSNDQRKVDAAVSVFRRYATESISFTALGHYLNSFKFLRGYNGAGFASQHVAGMLADPIYLGFYAWNKHHSGKFHRLVNGQAVPELNYAEQWTQNRREDWVQSNRLFKPLVDQKTWDAVQKKLAARDKRTNAPRTAQQYLSGLLFCGHCQCRMVAGPVQRGLHYFCSTYHAHIRAKNRSASPCLRNAVRQDVIEEYINRYLDEAGQRLEILTADPGSDAVDRLEDQEGEASWEFELGMERLRNYLMKHHTDTYRAILADAHCEDATPHEYVEAVIAAYRRSFDGAAIGAELARLQQEHSVLMGQWADLPTQLAKAKARARFETLEAKIADLEAQQENAADAVEQHYGELLELQEAIRKAKIAMQAEAGERILRQRGQAIRSVIHRIDCTFEATGKTGCGPGNANARLAVVTIHPVIGASKELYATSGNALLPTPVVSLW